MRETTYTFGAWQEKTGGESEFIPIWKKAGEIFHPLAFLPSGQGTLVQSLTDATLFLFIRSLE